MKGIDDDYKLSELLSGRRGSADVAINVAVVKFRFSGVVVLTKKNWCSIKPTKRLA